MNRHIIDITECKSRCAIYKIKYRFEKKFPTKVFVKKKYLGTNYSAYLRNLKMKNNHFYFKKAYKKIVKKEFVKSYYSNNNFQSIDIYSYDRIFETLNELIKKDKSIFHKKSDAGKGDKIRQSITQDEWGEKWEKIFGKREKKK